MSDIIFPEIELDGPAEFRVIGKVRSEDVTDYFNGAGDMAIHIIIPLSVAEYVENEAIQEKMKLYGIDYSQGYLFSKPSPEIGEYA